MSAGVSDQRMKGQGNQVSNGPKEQLGVGEGAVGSEEFEPWRNQQQNTTAHTAYGASVPISSATDIYNMSTAGYYGSGGTYPYQAYGVGDGTWSNGTDPMTFLSGYPHDSYSMDGMFGPSTTFSTPTAFAGQPSSFNYFHSNGDFNTWGSQLGGQRKYDDYYRDHPNMYTQAMPDSSLKSVEQAMQNLDLKASIDSKESLGQPKKTTWASIASQPAKPQLPIQNQGLKKKGPGMPPGPIVPGKHNMDIGTWDTNKTPPQLPPVVTNPPKSIVASAVAVRPGWTGPPNNRQAPPVPNRPQHPMPTYQPQGMMPPHLPPQVSITPGHIQGMMPPPMPPMMVQTPPQTTTAALTHPVLDELKGKNNYNPTDFDLTAPNARFFVIKSYSEDDIHRSIKYEIWCSTEHGNKRLDNAYRERGNIYLFFSVNGSGHFCGMAQMVTPVDYNANSSVWSQDKWKGQFKVRWIYVKDVPNVQLRHIRLENNDNKPVTNSRDTQEVPHSKGVQVLRIMHAYRHSTSIFDDFIHYEKRQEEEGMRRQPTPKENSGGGSGGSASGSHEGGGQIREHRERGDHRGGRNHDRDREREGGEGVHRSGGGGHRNNEHHGGGGHKDRESNRGRGGRGGSRN
ncbi:YTH domain-containing family protein 3 isoform X1 [Diabrotica virgifera virgifera]|uniref:YTH domain-containing family protein 3 isoform X3 n=1 Tax=Diabrotica virgifera virgifera TaxID=50390 RepID=A0A6P7FGP1_DIAVI|nr:YTH domain-containing family protein 3 isoform X1 [Diabrotica virgifera virgifera]